MNFQQLKIVREAVRQNFNLTEVGRVLFTSQSGVSKSLKDLEDELGIDIFARAGKRLVGLTPAGESVLDVINRILLNTHNLQVMADQFSSKAKGNLILATTHTQARYALPKYLKRFVLDFPDVHLTLHQGSPQEIRDLLVDGTADIGIATEQLHLSEELITFPWYNWQHGIIAPDDHPILKRESLTLESLAEFPLITYHSGFTGRSHLDEAFQNAGLEPDVVLTALDADVIKSYVELGLGLGVVASIAFNPERDHGLKFIPAGHLFGENITRIAVRRGHFLREYAYAFIERLSPQNTKQDILARIASGAKADS
jgi:LysR family cys regulon transcriptional activator